MGGAGNDVYVTDGDDEIIESLNFGTDLVRSSVGFILGANLENLTLTGTGATNGTGNAGANRIVGNGAANQLDGLEGNDTLDGGIDALADTLIGGLGNDIYIINSAVDNIIELVGGGVADRAQISVSFALAAGDNIEFLETTNANAVTALSLIGNEIAQTITGNAGSNIINGGLGLDNLAGGLGSDFFVFNTLPNGTTNRDTITDFNVVADTIQLENTGIFTALGAMLGILDVALFKNLTTGGAVDASDRILYDDTTGAVFYDSDGVGAAAAIQFVTITGAPTLTNADFLVV